MPWPVDLQRRPDRDISYNLGRPFIPESLDPFHVYFGVNEPPEEVRETGLRKNNCPHATRKLLPYPNYLAPNVRYHVTERKCLRISESGKSGKDSRKDPAPVNRFELSQWTFTFPTVEELLKLRRESFQDSRQPNLVNSTATKQQQGTISNVEAVNTSFSSPASSVSSFLERITKKDIDYLHSQRRYHIANKNSATQNTGKLFLARIPSTSQNSADGSSVQNETQFCNSNREMDDSLSPSQVIPSSLNNESSGTFGVGLMLSTDKTPRSNDCKRWKFVRRNRNPVKTPELDSDFVLNTPPCSSKDGRLHRNSIIQHSFKESGRYTPQYPRSPKTLNISSCIQNNPFNGY